MPERARIGCPLQPYPALIEVVVWLAYLVPMLLIVLWPRRAPRPVGAVLSESG